MKIAPTLQSFAAGWNTDTSMEERQAQAELRALLAVARAAKGAQGWTAQGPAAVRLDRALARLDRVSRKP